MERVQRVDQRPSSRTIRSSATPALGVECLAGRGEDHLAVDASKSRRADGAKQTLTTRAHRDRRRRAAVRAADSRASRTSATLTSDTVWDAARAAAAPGRARRRADRLRAGAVLRALRLEGHAGRDAAAASDPRGPGDLGDGRATASAPKASTCCVEHKAKRVRRRERREGPGRRARGRESAHRRSTSCCAPSGRVANTAGYGLEELGIPVTKAAHRRDQRVPADDLPEHLRLRRRRRARTSSRTPRRTRPGTRR